MREMCDMVEQLKREGHNAEFMSSLAELKAWGQSTATAEDPSNLTNDEFFAPYDWLSPAQRMELEKKRDAGYSIHFVSNLVELQSLFEARYGNGTPISVVFDLKGNEVLGVEFRKMRKLMKHWLRSTADNGPFPDGTVCMGCCKSISLAQGVKRLRCSRCRRSYFCSRECFSSNWPTHKRLCVPHQGDS